MDKTILYAGIVLVALGIGLFVVGSIDYTLSSAYTTGGILWSVVGVATMGVGLKVKQSKKQQMGALR